MAAVVLLMACAVSAQFPPGWNYDPFKYYPYTALQPPVQETPEVAAARASHLAAHAAIKGTVPVQPAFTSWWTPQQTTWLAPVPTPVRVAPVNTVQDTPEVWNAKVEHWRAHHAAAAANGRVSSLPPLFPVAWGAPQPVQDTPEVAAAKADFFRAYNAALTRSG